MAKEIEIVPQEEGVCVTVTRESGVVDTFQMTWDEFYRLQDEIVAKEESVNERRISRSH